MNILNNDDSHYMRWAIEVATQEFEGSMKQLFNAIENMEGC